MCFTSEYYSLTGEKPARSVLEEVIDGLPMSAAYVIQNSLSLTEQETGRLLGIPLSFSKCQSGKLSPCSSDKALLIMRVIQSGKEIFKNEVHLQNWIRYPNLTLSNKPPFELLHFSIGIEMVLDSLFRQHYSFVA
ncbi:antitoxin Xre/MbcA/ParS toxin-binding domain-containing protein [Alteromonas oceanisediminis]|uniref:antitoxin Xre/MbcA/ParS toxin-binding domain-containing protein n=1 Tax=Alteromonas oceanisediminis TaxID=2836180 RepID=UPI001BDAD519|nr:antitoxin Xre/MbcA/ParS toxin-binding domain-containing protein [Alteromonas oceanisediminis]MBT0587977.1 DUF2384 domain-containing protein [Alteromonas oceanisediminis]